MTKPIIVFDDIEDRHTSRKKEAKNMHVDHLIAFETDWSNYFNYVSETNEYILQPVIEYETIKCMFFHSSQNVPKFPEKTINQIKIKFEGKIFIIQFSGGKSDDTKNGFLSRETFDLHITRFAEFYRRFGFCYLGLFSKNDNNTVQISKSNIFKMLNRGLLNGKLMTEILNDEDFVKELSVQIFLTNSKFDEKGIIKNFETKDPDLLIDFINRNFK
jgi:hypothetical protein